MEIIDVAFHRLDTVIEKFSGGGELESSERERPVVAFPALRYRPEIDGLRAIAIIVVILFHAKLSCSGGYVGVDVFFVISGYLITSLILRGITTGEFRALEFWERRVRRIAPAMICTIFASMVAGWYLCWPSDFKRFGAAIIAQALFISNVFHWRNTGYFGADASALPLLHTWSLAVEEQFYIVLPTLLLVVNSQRRGLLPTTIVLGFLLSLGLSAYFTPMREKLAFFLLPTRAWEMLVGALLAAYPVWSGLRFRWVRELFCVSGLIAIATAVMTFDSRTPFPGTNALLPCLGAAAIIWAACAGMTIGGSILASKPMVFVGLISYSLYLVHWPVFVFSYYWFGEDDITLAGRLSLVAITFLLGTLSWAIVETPVRKKWLFSTRPALFSFAAGSLLIQIILGAVIYINDGFPSRFEARVYKYGTPETYPQGDSYQCSLKNALDGEFRNIGTTTGKIKCLLWGDSHAMALSFAIENVCRKKGFRGVQATHSSTAPLLDFIHWSKASLKGSSPEFNEAIVKFAIKQQIDVVIMAGFWSDYAEDPLIGPCLTKTIDALTSEKIKVVIVKDVPIQSGNVPRILMRAAFLKQPVSTIGISLEAHHEKNVVTDRLFDHIANPLVTVLDPAIYLADDTGICRAEFDGESLYRDSQHLSVAGSLRLIPMFEPMFQDDQ